MARIIKGNSMRFGLDFTVKAILVSGILTHGAAAQTPVQMIGKPISQPVSQSAAETSNSVRAGSGTNAMPEWMNAGTLAESADTTALTTSTYHQPTGFLPGMKP